MKEMIWNFLCEEEGVTAVEYGLIAGILSLVIIGGLNIGGPALERIFDTIGDELAASPGGAGGG